MTRRGSCCVPTGRRGVGELPGDVSYRHRLLPRQVGPDRGGGGCTRGPASGSGRSAGTRSSASSTVSSYSRRDWCPSTNGVRSPARPPLARRTSSGARWGLSPSPGMANCAFRSAVALREGFTRTVRPRSSDAAVALAGLARRGGPGGTLARFPARPTASLRRAPWSRARLLALAGCGPLPRSCRSGCCSCSSVTQRGTGRSRSSRAPPPCARTTSRCGPAVRSSARSRLGAARRPATGQMQGYSGSHPNAPRGRCPRRASRRIPRPGRWAPGSPE